MKTFRCKIERHIDGMRLAYVGPVDRVPRGWSIVMRRAAR